MPIILKWFYFLIETQNNLIFELNYYIGKNKLIYEKNRYSSGTYDNPDDKYYIRSPIGLRNFSLQVYWRR